MLQLPDALLLQENSQWKMGTKCLKTCVVQKGNATSRLWYMFILNYPQTDKSPTNEMNKNWLCMLYNSGPGYLKEHILPDDLAWPLRALRKMLPLMPLPQWDHFTGMWDRAFLVAAPRLWNFLQIKVRLVSSLLFFLQQAAPTPQDRLLRKALLLREGPVFCLVCFSMVSDSVVFGCILFWLYVF